MLYIISKEGYPKNNQILARVDYFILEGHCSGGILIVGKDSQGIEYKPKGEPRKCIYSMPQKGATYSIPIDNEMGHPAIYFGFELKHNLSSQEIIDANKEGYDKFLSKFDLTLMDESLHKISLDAEIEEFFKYIAAWGAFELAEDARLGKISNRFWGEIYRERTSALEKFLELYRG